MGIKFNLLATSFNLRHTVIPCYTLFQGSFFLAKGIHTSNAKQYHGFIISPIDMPF